VLSFVRSGLREGERVLYIAADRPRDQVTAELARAGGDVSDALDAERLIVGTSGDRYLADGRFTADRTIDGLRREIEVARDAGFDKMRLVGEMSWALDKGTDLRSLIEYEARVDGMLRETATAALCQYDRRLFDLVTRRATERVHPLVLAERDGYGGAACELLVERGPNGDTILRGEADGASSESLQYSLRAAVARSHDVRLDLSDLSFIGAASLSTIRDAARTLDARGGRLTLVSPRPVVRHVVTLMGFPASIAIEGVA